VFYLTIPGTFLTECSYQLLSDWLKNVNSNVDAIANR